MAKDATVAPNFHGIIREVSVLGFDEKPVWNRDEEALKIKTEHIQSDKPVVFKIRID